ncbi:MAG: hypothetical protein OEW72_07800, partial [Gammaproteobacteria bacterium]|nr:hypothetical protein [Gammaproteobacteria bacterium]
SDYSANRRNLREIRPFSRGAQVLGHVMNAGPVDEDGTDADSCPVEVRRIRGIIVLRQRDLLEKWNGYFRQEEY